MSLQSVVRVGVLTPIARLDPRDSHDFTGNLIIEQVFEAPYRRREDGSFEGILVQGPLIETRVRTGLQYETKVRSDKAFSDGSPLTAEDVVKALRLLPALDDFLLQAKDDLLIIRPRGAVTRRPEEVLCDRMACVLKEVDGCLLGTGPFVIEEADGTQVLLRQNPHATQETSVERIEVRYYPSNERGKPEGLLSALLEGKCDLSIALSPDDVQEHDQLEVRYQRELSTCMLYLNTRTEHFKRLEVRRAVARALDTKRLAGLCFSDPESVVTRVLLPPGLEPGERFVAPALPEGERLRPGVLPATMTLVRVWGPRPYLPRPDAVAKAIVEAFEGLGSKVVIEETQTGDDYFKRLRSGKYDMVLGGWMADTPDPFDFLNSIVGAAGVPVPGRSPVTTANYARWEDEQIESALSTYRRTGSTEHVHRILARVADQVPLIPIMHGPRILVHTRRVEGIDPAGILPDLSTVRLRRD